MQPLDLNKVREAVEKIDAYFTKEARHESNCTCGSDGEPSGCYIHDTLAVTGPTLAAITAHLALSDYDRAITMITEGVETIKRIRNGVVQGGGE